MIVRITKCLVCFSTDIDLGLNFHFYSTFNATTTHGLCVGVPYRTSLWHVADSKQQNGSYKIALFRAKKKLLDAKMNYMIDPLTLDPIDIVSKFNIAWAASFAKVQQSKRTLLTEDRIL